MPSPGYSPTLADRVAAQTRDGLDVVVEKLAEAIGPPNASGAAEADTSGSASSVRLGPVPAMLELSPLLLSSQVLRMLDGALEVIFDFDELPADDGRALTARLFDNLRDSFDILDELSFVDRENFSQELSDEMTQLLDAGIVLMGGSYDRGITGPQGHESWRGAVIKATPIPKKDAARRETPMSPEDATAIALAQVRIDKGDFEAAEVGLRPVAAAGNGHALLLLGMLLRDRGRLDDAAEMLRRAVDVGRQDALTPLGLCLSDLGELDEAEAVLVQAAEHQSKEQG